MVNSILCVSLQHLRNPVLNATNLVHHLKLLMLDKNTLDDDVFKRFVQYYLLTYQARVINVALLP